MKQFFLSFAIVFLTAIGAHAQTIVNSNMPDNPLLLHNHSYACSTDAIISGVKTINCDLHDVYLDGASGASKLFAVAYTAYDINMLDPIAFGGCFWGTLTPTLFTGIRFGWTGLGSLNQVDFYIPNAEDPDVVIGDDLSGAFAPMDRIVGIVYNHINGTDVEITTMAGSNLTGTVAVGRMISAPVTGIKLNRNPGWTARNPHIDLFGDASNSNYSIFNLDRALTKFIVTWEETMGGSSYIMAAIGDLANPSAFAGPYTISTDGRNPDVGALGIDNSGSCCGTSTDYAYITYIEASTGDLKLATLDITGTSVNTFSTATLSVLGTDHSAIDNPRIEARNFADPTDTKTNWQVAVSLIPLSGTDYEIHTFNSKVSTSTVLSCSVGEQHFSPVVTGVGEDVDATSSGRVGETNFTTVYYSTYTNGTGTNGDIFANELDITTGILASNNYYEVNNTPLYQGFLSAGDIQVAAATSSNTGQDLFVVWYQGWDAVNFIGEFRYQFGGNTYTFKPGKPSSVSTVNNEIISVSPNPVTDILNINGIKKAKYSVIDGIGRSVLNGEISTFNNTISTKSLAPGGYFVIVIQDEKCEKVKFVKY